MQRILQVTAAFLAALILFASPVIAEGTTKGKKLKASAPAAQPYVAPAADPAPVLAPAPSWTGPWIGGNVGYAAQITKSKGEDGGFVSEPFRFDNATDGFTYGAAIGYDHQFDRIVAGLFADYDWTNASNKVNVPVGSGFTVGDMEIASMYTLGARLGFLITPHVLLYGQGGWTHVNWSAPTNATTGAINDPTGVMLGAGIEAQTQSGWAAKVDYRFVDLGSDTLTKNVPGPIDAKITDDHNMHVVRFGLSYRFNWPR